MGKVISLDDHRPHNSGQAKCLGCQHEWFAVAPADTHGNLECPSCSLSKGEFSGNFFPADAETYQCSTCGNDLWLVLRDGIFCRGCGATTSLEDL